ncbi:MAG: RNA degradosome polyphosphate kinase [Veillonellaceae bacterium]|nr:RNA degradosome polyphosphate kinase [Veillonellaceae bacterium]
MDFDKPEYFLNRELSWLKFNERVLAEASAPSSPLLERLKFIAITSSNLDEFFMVRVGALKNQQEESRDWVDAAGMSASRQLSEIAKSAHRQVKQQYRLLKELRREMATEQIQFLSADNLATVAAEWLRKYFENIVAPVLTPLAVDASHPFPFLANRSLNLGVTILNKTGEANVAVVQVPAVLPRLLEIPVEKGKRSFVFLEDVIRIYCRKLFHGFQIKNVVPFRITRNADFLIDEEEADDLLLEVERSLRQRKRGRAVRLEIGATNNKSLKKFLLTELRISDEDLYEINGPLDLTCFNKFADISGMDHLRHAPLQPQRPLDLLHQDNLFDAIRERDILLHHPYESFRPVIEFVRQAADDPDVLAIKQTLYRVSGNSPIVRALAQAAENGKQVTVVVEIMARFDEENNILWARRLEESGCHVIYGLVGLKTHAKMCLVVRREDGGIRRYVHMGTGNYNDATARVYTDMGLFTANDQLGADASGFFNVLTGYSDPPVWNKIAVSPLGLRDRIVDLIDQEIQIARDGKPARIIAKMNSLVDQKIIMQLYEASEAGVRIDLVVRGICALRPGLPGVSANITVRSIVGRFLEHSRIFYFSGGGEQKCFLSSADWMPRNLNNRVELFFPVENESQRDRIFGNLELLLADNQKAHEMRSDGSYRRRKLNRKLKINAQEELVKRAHDNAADAVPASWPLVPLNQLTEQQMGG